MNSDGSDTVADTRQSSHFESKLHPPAPLCGDALMKLSWMELPLGGEAQESFISLSWHLQRL